MLHGNIFNRELLLRLLFAIFRARHVPCLQEGGDPMSSRLLSNVAVIAVALACDTASEVCGANVVWTS